MNSFESCEALLCSADIVIALVISNSLSRGTLLTSDVTQVGWNEVYFREVTCGVV